MHEAVKQLWRNIVMFAILLVFFVVHLQNYVRLAKTTQDAQLFVEIIESKLAVGLTSEDEEGHKEVDAVVSQVLSDAVAGDQKKVRWSLFWVFLGGGLLLHEAVTLVRKWFVIRKKPDAPHHEMVSLVALLPSWKELSVEEVRESLDAIFPGCFLPPQEDNNFVIDGPSPGASYFVQCTVPEHSGLFVIFNVARPYSEFSDYLVHLPDAELKDLGAKQPCWMSVDMVHQTTTDEDAYRFIGAVLAKLAPPDATVILHPSKYAATTFSSEVRRRLASGDSPFGNA